MVDILLATYNGDKYLNSQILSIVGQTYKDWTLIIHDDGSTDNTIGIIKEWAAKDSRIHYVDDGVKCGGSANNFMHLLKYSSSDYIMFCDQDDIWFDNKVELMYKEILKLDDKKPRVVYSNSMVWKPEVGVTGLATFTFATDLKHLLFLNSGVQGCVSIFDRKIKELMKEYSGPISMHDHLLQLMAVTIGSCVFKNMPMMLYRNHGENVTGDTRTKLITKNNILSLRKHPVIDESHYLTIKQFYKIYKTMLNQEDRKIMHAYIEMPYLNFYQRLWGVIHHGFKLYDSTLLLLVKLIIRPYHNMKLV